MLGSFELTHLQEAAADLNITSLNKNKETELNPSRLILQLKDFTLRVVQQTVQQL